MQLLRFKNSEQGFTLLEILLAISIIGIIGVYISNIHLTAWQLFNKGQTTINLNQQARIIDSYLKNDIKRAVDVDIRDVDSDGDNELLLNLGENTNSDQDDTDDMTHYYLQYNVKNQRLNIKKTANFFNDSGVRYPNWPEPAAWGENRAITKDIVSDFEFKDLNNNRQLIFYEFKISMDNDLTTVSNTIHPRILME